MLQKVQSPKGDRVESIGKAEILESIKPETVQKQDTVQTKNVPKTDSLLSEQTVSNKEQRKADWAIMKEMARYLWPKVKFMM